MGREGIFHLRGTRLEDVDQVAVTPIEILQHVRHLLGGRVGGEPQHAADDVVGAGPVDRVEVTWLDGRFEGADDDAGRIRPEDQILAVKKVGVGQMSPSESV